MGNLDRLNAMPGSSEWYTPSWIIESVREIMGTIDLDPASSALANETVQAATFYDIESDGLSQYWEGNVWLNPPYARSKIPLWIDRLINSPDIDQWICITNNATETKWAQDLLAESGMVLFLGRRVKFWSHKRISNSPTQGQMIVASRSVNKSLFVEKFKPYGTFFDTIGAFAATVRE